MELPQFKLKIPVTDWGQIDIHFVHKRSSRQDAIPLLFIHGCSTPNSCPKFYVRAWSFSRGPKTSPITHRTSESGPSSISRSVHPPSFNSLIAVLHLYLGLDFLIIRKGRVLNILRSQNPSMVL